MTIIDPETLRVIASFEHIQCIGRALRVERALPLIALVAPAIPDEVAEFAPEAILIDVEQAYPPDLEEANADDMHAG